MTTIDTICNRALFLTMSTMCNDINDAISLAISEININVIADIYRLYDITKDDFIYFIKRRLYDITLY